jgi:hypothetical protein
VAPASADYDIVRVAYTGFAAGGAYNGLNGPNGPYVVKVVTAAIQRVKVNPIVRKTAPKVYPLSLSATGASALNLNFIQPDGFDYFAAFPGVVLPDTSVLTWTEGGSASTGGTPGMLATASFAVASGPPLFPTDGNDPSDPGLSDGFPLSVKFETPCPKGAPCTKTQRRFYNNFDSLLVVGPIPPTNVNGPTGQKSMGDFEDGTFAYDKATNVFQFVSLWAQPSGAPPAAAQKPEVHYNIVEVAPPPPRKMWFTNVHIRPVSASTYSLKVTVPSRAHVSPRRPPSIAARRAVVLARARAATSPASVRSTLSAVSGRRHGGRVGHLVGQQRTLAA